MTLTTTEELLYATHRIERLNNGQITGTGSGFTHRVPLSEEKEIMVLITNRHVVAGGDAIRFLAHLKGPDGMPTGVTEAVVVPATSVFAHPDSAIDLVAITIGKTINDARNKGRPLFIKAVWPELIPTQADWENFDAVEDVIMIGCPQGIFDTVTGRPIARRGVTATPCYADYCGSAEFLVDMACFPGSSGSPVFMVTKDGFNRAENTTLIGSPRLFLLGILHAGPTITNKGTVVLGQVPTFEVTTMMHLGQVIRSTALEPLSAHLRQLFTM